MPQSAQLFPASTHPDLGRTLNTAIEKASATGLTLSERFHQLMASVYTPELSAYQPENDLTLNSTHARLYTLNAFKSIPRFQNFKNIVAQTLVELDAIANTRCTAGEHNTHFQNFGDELWQPVGFDTSSRFGLFQKDLYEQACPDAERLVRIHAFARHRPDLVAVGAEENARASIKDLSQRLDVCGPGIVQYFEEAVDSVRQATFTPSLTERFENLRIQITRNAIAEFVGRQPDLMGNRVGNEVHQVAAWQNYFSRTMHLPWITDVYASASYVENPADQVGLKSKLLGLQTKSAIATVLASQILEEAHDLWHQAQANDATDFASHCMTLIERMKNRHGPVEPHTLIQMDEDGMPCKLHDNPTLLALSLIRQVQDAAGINTRPEEIRQWQFREHNPESPLFIKIRGNLCWVETTLPAGNTGEPEQQLLGTQQISPEYTRILFDFLISPQFSSTELKRMVQELLRNDWGSSRAQFKSQNFNPNYPDDVFLNLAMGFTQGLKLGNSDLNFNYMHVLSKALNHLNRSSALHQYSSTEIYQLLDYAHTLDTSSYGKKIPLNVSVIVNIITNLQPANVGIPLYKAALEFNWTHRASRAAKLAIGNPAFAAPRPDHGLAYIEVMERRAPHLLNTTLCKNIKFIRHTEMVLRLFEACETSSPNEAERDRALQFLIQRNDDAFVARTLRKLANSGVSLQALTDPNTVNDLLGRSMGRTANFLTASAA